MQEGVVTGSHHCRAVSFLSDDRLTPEVIDGAAEHAFSPGACAILACALREVIGWTIIGITDAHNVHDGKLGGGSSLLWGVLRPDGKFVDIDGAHEIDEVVERYKGDADDEETAWGKGTQADINEWYVENQGAPISYRSRERLLSRCWSAFGRRKLF